MDDPLRVRITNNRMTSIGTFGGVFLSDTRSGGVATFGVVIPSGLVDAVDIRENSFVNVGLKTLVVPHTATIQSLCAQQAIGPKAPPRCNH